MARVSEMYFEELGEAFDRNMSSYDVAQRLQLITGLLPRGPLGRVLEVGCGTGAISQYLSTRTPKLTVCDLSEKLAAAVARKLRCDWAAEDACALRFADASFDCVVSSECIEHTPRPLAAVREMARVLKPDGHLVITTPNRLWYPVLWMSMRLHLRKFAGNELWVWPQDVRRALVEAGLHDITLRGCHLFPWQLPASKPLLRRLDHLGRWLYPVMINFAVSAHKLAASPP